jgi:hypothetical protein
MTYQISSFLKKEKLIHAPETELLERIEQYCNTQMWKRKPKQSDDFYQYQLEQNKLIAINYVNQLRGAPHSTETEKVAGLNYFKMIDSLDFYTPDEIKAHMRNMINMVEYEKLGAFLGW